jgi:phosphoribosylamine--glycine ligase
MRVLVVGSGGREHALAWRLAQEGVAVEVAPGNGGTPHNVPIQALDIQALVTYADRERPDLTIVGPEAPLAGGIVDTFTQHGLTVLGATRAMAQLESSKVFAKAFLERHGIPTGRAEVVVDEVAARKAVARSGLPVVLKADGLASGKGVFVCHTHDELESAIDALFRQRIFGAASDRVLVEQYLEGPELSVMAFCDGEGYAIMPPARDYKRLLQDDRGPNTGGMGGVARPSYATQDVIDEVAARVFKPTVAGMHYRGILYAGLILTPQGPKVLEFNCRFGDPEAELVLPLMESSLVDACLATASGTLKPEMVRWRQNQTYGVVLAAPGYPEAPRTGEPIHGLDRAPRGVEVFHAGTRRYGDEVLTNGGRVLCLVSDNRASVYSAADAIQFDGKQFRRDIGAVTVGKT